MLFSSSYKMGCKICSDRLTQTENCISKLQLSIDNDDCTSLKQHLLHLSSLLNKSPSLFIDDKLITSSSVKLTLLSYCVHKGSASCYRYLRQRCEASFEIMQDNMETMQLSPLSSICENGHSDLLAVYFPEFYEKFGRQRARQDSFPAVSLFSAWQEAVPMTPIQLACKNGHLAIVSYFAEFFKDSPPPELSIHHIDPNTGENCALVAVRFGSFLMVKMLYEKYKADFYIHNKRKEGVLQILAAQSRKSGQLSYTECLTYLVNVVKVDVLDGWQETLRLMEQKVMVQFLEGKLKEMGVDKTKEGLEKERKTEGMEESLNGFSGCSKIMKNSSNSDFKGSSKEGSYAKLWGE
jgi:hypothetical protein